MTRLASSALTSGSCIAALCLAALPRAADADRLFYARVPPGMVGIAQPGGSPALLSRVTAIVEASGAEVAVAFRTLDGERELLVRPDERFHAASTMKVPVMIELFRQASTGRFSLDERVPVINSFKSLADGSEFSLTADSDDDKALYTAVGQPRSYRELCDLMITVSSNLATNNLIERIGVDNIRATVTRLGADGMDVRRGVEDSKAYRAGLNNTTSARGLLVLLEAIARGKAVSPEADVQMIDVLARQKFNDGIPAGLSPGTRVAHKTGTITKIHHDAAIVFAPRPYVLVVMTRGLDEAPADRVIADITRVLDDEASRTDRR